MAPRPLAATIRSQVEAALATRAPGAFQIFARPEPEWIVTALPGVRVPRGALSEICGPPSSGRTSALLAVLAATTQKREFCALIDTEDNFHPASAAAAGVHLPRLLWVRCADAAATPAPREKPLRRPARQRDPAWALLARALQATDLILQSGGFGVVALDLAGLPPRVAERVPLTTWFRFRKAVQPTATALVALEQIAHAGSAAAWVLQMSAAPRWSQLAATQLAHTRVYTGLELDAESGRKRPGSVPEIITAAAATGF